MYQSKAMKDRSQRPFGLTRGCEQGDAAMCNNGYYTCHTPGAQGGGALHAQQQGAGGLAAGDVYQLLIHVILPRCSRRRCTTPPTTGCWGA